MTGCYIIFLAVVIFFGSLLLLFILPFPWGILAVVVSILGDIKIIQKLLKSQENEKQVAESEDVK